MKNWKSLVVVGSLLLGGSGCSGPGIHATPQEKAAYMLDQQIIDIKSAIANHEFRMPGDRNRWQESDITILNNLYVRLDDLYRQRQVLAVEVGNQTFDPKTAAQPKAPKTK